MQSEPEFERGMRRIFRAGGTGIATLLARGIVVAVGLFTLPITSHYLGRERFGLWLTLSSFISWFSMADLGLANSLINALSAADGRDDRESARKAVSSAFWLIAIISGAIVLICLPVIPLVPWNKVFNLNSNLAASEITASILILLIFCALRLPASVISAVYQAYQEGYIYQIFNGLSGLLSAGCLVAAINLRLGLQWLVLAFLIGMIAGDLFSAVWLFGKWRYWLRPEIKLFDLKQSKWLLKRGSQFWIAQIAAVAMLQTDLIIVSRLFGPSEVAVYGTTLRIFLITGAVQTAFVAPLWAAYGEASARRDIVWLEKAYKRSILISILWSLVFSGFLFLAMPLLFSFLVTPDIKPDSHLTLAMMVTEVVNSAARCISTFLNGLGEIRLQAMLGPAGGALNIVLSLFLAKQMGPPGVAWATAICLTLFWLIIMGWESALQLRKLRLNSHGA